MKIDFDQKNDIMRIKFSNDVYQESKEVDEGIIIDIGKDNKIVAIEILDASEKISRESLKKVKLSSAS